MSAGGSTGGTTFVWIKLATAKVFVKISLYSFDKDDVSDVTTRACSSFAWGLTANQVRVYLVAVSGDEPGDEAIEAALLTKRLAVNAPVTSGAWLVAMPAPGSFGGGEGDGGGGGVGASHLS
jgi:hypothetical protein